MGASEQPANAGVGLWGLTGLLRAGGARKGRGTSGLLMGTCGSGLVVLHQLTLSTQLRTAMPSHRSKCAYSVLPDAGIYRFPEVIPGKFEIVHCLIPFTGQTALIGAGVDMLLARLKQTKKRV